MKTLYDSKILISNANLLKTRINAGNKILFATTSFLFIGAEKFCTIDADESLKTVKDESRFAQSVLLASRNMQWAFVQQEQQIVVAVIATGMEKFTQKSDNERNVSLKSDDDDVSGIWRDVAGFPLSERLLRQIELL